MLVEGAGSASEVNLRAGDIANMGFARAADVPVVLVGDIDRGGVIASLVGTKAVLDEADAAMIRGFIVNRFRGDPSPVRRAACASWPSAPAGRRSASCRISPMPRGFRRRTVSGLRREGRKGSVVIAVPVTPWISNFDDLDPLREEPGRRGGSGRARPAAAGRGGARPAARLQDHHRRSSLHPRAGLGHRPQGACAPRRAGARPLRRLPDAGHGASTIPSASRARRAARSRGSACSTSRPRSRQGSGWRP